MLIIYPFDDGISIIHPTGSLPVSEVAKKDVPAGLPYLFIEEDEVPNNRDSRDAWEADFSQPDGYGIGAEAWFAEQSKKEGTQ